MEVSNTVKIRYSSATITRAVRVVMHRPEVSIVELRWEQGANPETAAKWRKRQKVEDRKNGLQELCSTVLSKDNEAMMAAFL